MKADEHRDLVELFKLTYQGVDQTHLNSPMLLHREEFFVSRERLSIRSFVGKIGRKEQISEIEPQLHSRLLNFIRYCLDNILKLPESKQLPTLTHLLSAIAEEENLRFSHLIYQAEDLTAQRWIDPFNSSQTIDDICAKSVETAATAEEERRYKLELEQWILLKNEISEKMTYISTVVLNSIAIQSEALIELSLRNRGFLPATSEQRELLHYYQHRYSQSVDNEDISYNLWSAPQKLYCMPPSQVHPGGFSIIVLVQPFYDLESSRLCLMQTQLLVDLGSQKLKNLLGGKDQLEMEPQTDDTRTLEQWLLRRIKSLENDTQQLNHQKVIRQLLTKANPQMTINHEPLSQELITKYATMFLSALRLEQLNGGQISAESITRLCDFFYTVVFKGLKTPDFELSESIITKAIDKFQQMKSGNSSSNRMDIEMKGVGLPYALNRVSSISQCVAFSPLSSLSTQQLVNNGQALTTLNHSQLATLIGSERAKDWKMGRCRKCGAKTLVGECGWCFRCEVSDQQKTVKRLNNESRNGASDLRQKQPNNQHLFQQDLPKVGLQEVINGQDKQLVVQYSYPTNSLLKTNYR